MQQFPRLNKPLLMLVKVAIYTLIYYGFIGLTILLLREPYPALAFLLSLSIIVPNRGKLTNILQQWIDRNFYRRLYRLKQAARLFNQDLNALLEFDLLVERFTRFLSRTFSRDAYQLYLYGDNYFLTIEPNDHQRRQGVTIPFELDDTSLAVFKKSIHFYAIDDLRETYPPIRSLLEATHSVDNYLYFVPLHGATGVVGFLLFTEAIKPYLNTPEVRDYLNLLLKKTADVLENARIHSEIKRKSLETNLLLEVVKNISSTLSLEGVLQSIIDNLSQLVSFDAAAILLIDEDGKKLRQVVSTGYDENKENLLTLKLNQGISGWVIENKRGSVIADVEKDPHYYSARPQTRSQITVPIIILDKAIGALVLESNELSHFTKANMELLTIFSGLAAISIRNAQLYEDSLRKQRLESELLVASKVQQRLLPRRAPTVTGIEIEILNIPSLIVGGDLYDVFCFGQGRQGIAIGDVSGKGAPAALLMAVTYAGFKSLLKEIDPVSTVVARLNNFMVETTTTGNYVTFFYGILTPRERKFTYCNAGHNPPILFRKNGAVEYLNEGGTVVGFLADRTYTQATVSLGAGDYLCLYTDGVTEMQNPQGDEFGEDRLIKTFQKHYGKSPKKIKQVLIEEIKTFAQSREFQDDLTLIILRVE